MVCLHLFDACPDPGSRGLSDTIDARHKWNVRKCDEFEPFDP